MQQFPLSKIKALPFDFAQAVTDFVAAKQAHRFTVDEPAPSAPHPWVHAAVTRVPGEDGKPDDFVPAYDIVDDTPTTDQRKMQLAGEVQRAAAAAIAAVIPPLKARLLAMDNQKASAVDSAKRSATERAAIVDYDARQQRVAAITYKLAQFESQIHDLAENDIDGFKFSF